ncbi:MAG: AAA family ATPase [Microbacterium sp.]|nr:AAA family ATPase [Microbacterium sp.]
MRISHLTVRNYRSLEQLDMEVTDYTALVGANGAGKSSVLYALDWFFKGQDLDESDITDHDGSVAADSIEVAVTFSDLTTADRQALGQFGRGDLARVRRIWRRDGKGTKIVGRALQGPGFVGVRNVSSVPAMRTAYRALAQTTKGLPRLAGNVPKSDITAALDEWESQSTNLGALVEVEDVDASDLFGTNGTFQNRIRLVLIPAATDMPNQLSGATKGSALSELVGAVIADAGVRARDEWLSAHRADLQELNERVRAGVQASVTAQADRINSTLAGMVPDARVNFVPMVPEWEPRGDVAVETSVTLDGATTEITRQGHGVQRAVMIALFQSLIENPAQSEGAAHSASGEPDTGPALVICIEEPEIYQHPVRARSFGRILANLSERPGAQVVIATHSPYFVSPGQFESIRRFRIDGGRSSISIASVAEICRRSGADHAAVRKVVEKQIPTTFSEGFFADAVVLVEGDTDRVVIETLAARIGTPLDEHGIAVLVMGGKPAFRIPYALFGSLGVTTFVVVDGDAEGASRKYSGAQQSAQRAQAEASNRQATDNVTAWLPGSAARLGELPYEFGSSSVVANDFVIWRDDLESELAAWPTFVAALESTGCRLRQKNALAYRAAALDADIADMPYTLTVALRAIADANKSSLR